jgi:hypothetical protein
VPFSTALLSPLHSAKVPRMSKEVVGDARAQAEELMARLIDPLDESHVALGFSANDRAEVTDAMEHDLATAGNTTEQRLQKVEAQTHGLAEAVIAIAEPSLSLAPAVQAVKDEM